MLFLLKTVDIVILVIQGLIIVIGFLLLYARILNKVYTNAKNSVIEIEDENKEESIETENLE